MKVIKGYGSAKTGAKFYTHKKLVLLCIAWHCIELNFIQGGTGLKDWTDSKVKVLFLLLL